MIASSCMLALALLTQIAPPTEYSFEPMIHDLATDRDCFVIAGDSYDLDENMDVLEVLVRAPANRQLFQSGFDSKPIRVGPKNARDAVYLTVSVYKYYAAAGVEISGPGTWKKRAASWSSNPMYGDPMNFHVGDSQVITSGRYRIRAKILELKTDLAQNIISRASGSPEFGGRCIREIRIGFRLQILPQKAPKQPASSRRKK
jgi:hypothetical protein